MITKILKNFILAVICTIFVNTNTTLASENIVKTAENAGNFSRLIKALTFVGLDKVLEEKGSFTVLAPTDEAFDEFDKKNPGLLAELMEKGDEGKEKIKNILLYHVVKGLVPAQKVMKMTSNKSLNGDEFEVEASSNGVMINDANVVKTDIKASNGIIHVIDKVLVPPSMK